MFAYWRGFAFESGEIWGVDTILLAYDTKHLYIGEIEKAFVESLKGYSRFLTELGVIPPYEWIAGLTGIKGRQLLIPLPHGQMRVPGWPGPECLSDTVTAEGFFDPAQAPSSVLLRFFETIYNKCGVPRPDYLPR